MPNKDDSAPVIDRAKYGYSSARVADPKTGKVRNVVSNGDAVARALSLTSFDDLPKIAKSNGVSDKFDKFKNTVNAGMVRMNLGNVLRAMVRNGTEVTIGEYTIKKLDQREPVVKEAPKAERAIRDKPAPKVRQKKVA